MFLLPNDLSQPLTQEINGEALGHGCSQLLHPRDSPGGRTNQKQSCSAWSASTVAEQTPDKLVAGEANNSRDEGLEKRKGKIYFGCWQLGEVASSSVNNQPLYLVRWTLQVFWREVRGVGGGGTRKRAGRERSQVGVSNCLAQDHGQVRGWPECSLLGIPVLSGLFWSGT